MAKKSSLSGRELAAGQRVICAVFLDELGNFCRDDFLKDEFDDSKVSGRIIGRWERVVSENPGDDERAARRMALAGAEDFFMSLFDETSGVEAEEKDAVKQMLSLLLERKRVLRALGRPAGGVQKYLHVSTKKELEVPQLDLSADLVAKIRTQLNFLII